MVRSYTPCGPIYGHFSLSFFSFFEMADTRWHRAVPGPRGKDSRPSPPRAVTGVKKRHTSFKNVQDWIKSGTYVPPILFLMDSM